MIGKTTSNGVRPGSLVVEDAQPVVTTGKPAVVTTGKAVALQPDAGPLAGETAQAVLNQTESKGAVVGLRRWEAALRTTDPQQLQRALFDLAQELPYLAAAAQQSLTSLAAGSPARQKAGLAAVWAEGMFRLGGSVAEQALLAHSAGRVGTAGSRALAAARAGEMRLERETRVALQSLEKPASSADLLRLPVPAGFGDGVNDLDEITLSSADLAAQITALGAPASRARLLAAGIAPAVATDCDGTTWMHDIGEALFAEAVEQRRFLPAAQAQLVAFLEGYGMASTGEVNRDAALLLHAYETGELYERGAARGKDPTTITLDYYAANVWCFAGHSVGTMKKWGRDLFEREGGFAGKIFAGLQPVFDTARGQGLIPYAVSASNQWIVEVAAEYLGIPPWRVRGMQTAVENGIITGKLIEPTTYGAGKVAAAIELTGGRPAIAMGDSVDATDREMLESALLRLAVEPKSSRHDFVLARGEDNWRFVDYTHTVDGEAADLLKRS